MGHGDPVIIEIRHELMRGVREFFSRHGYLEIETAYLRKTAPPDPYIEPLRVFVGERGPYYLHTSPEVGMKKLLTLGHRRLFQVCRVFRVEELEEAHATEFTMLEWYREGTYVDAMAETKQLFAFLSNRLPRRTDCFEAPWAEHDLESLFLAHARLSPFQLDRASLFTALSGRGFVVSEDEPWEDLFFKLFLQEIEPRIDRGVATIVRDWPLSLSLMAKGRGAAKAERFEVYAKGLELANGYTELLDPAEQRHRFERDNKKRRSLGLQEFPIDEGFLSALSRIDPPVAGVAVGLDRLLMVLLDKERIDEVITERHL